MKWSEVKCSIICTTYYLMWNKFYRLFFYLRHFCHIIVLASGKKISYHLVATHVPSEILIQIFFCTVKECILVSDLDFSLRSEFLDWERKGRFGSFEKVYTHKIVPFRTRELLAIKHRIMAENQMKIRKLAKIFQVWAIMILDILFHKFIYSYLFTLYSKTAHLIWVASEKAFFFLFQKSIWFNQIQPKPERKSLWFSCCHISGWTIVDMTSNVGQMLSSSCQVHCYLWSQQIFQE